MPIEHILKQQVDSLKRGVLSIWTVYDHPADFPHSYVARRFETKADGSVHPTNDIVQGELEMIRKSFAICGLVCLTRNDSDEPQIMESWL